MKKILISIVLVLVLLVGCLATFAACKDSGSNGVVVVGYTLYEPMNYEENGELVGFDTDLAKAVFKELNYEVVFKEINWDAKYMDLNSGNITCIWNGFTSSCTDTNAAGETVNRKDLVSFSYDYMKNYQAVVVKASEQSSYTDFETSFAGKQGYVEAGSAGEEYAENAKGATIKTATKQMEAIMQVKTGAADFAVVDYLLANSIVGKGDFQNLAFVSQLNSEVEYYAIGFKKGSKFTAKVNAVLEKFAKNGKLAEIAKKYGLDNAVITDFSSQK